MSLEAYMWAFKAKVCDPQAKLILLCLAARHNPRGGLYPSQSRIAADSGLSRATVNRKLAQLEGQGFIRRLPHDPNADRKRRSLNYLLAIDPGFDSTPAKAPRPTNGLTLQQPKGLTARRADGLTEQQTTVAASDTNPYLEIVPSESSPKAPLAGEADQTLSAIAAHLAALTPDTSTKPAFCDALAVAITRLGHEVNRDVKIDDRGDGRSGVIDILVMQAGLPWLAIVVDRTQPTRKSAAKLSEFAGGLIVLRESAWSGKTFEGFPVLHFGRRNENRPRNAVAQFDEVKRKLLGEDLP
jgi:hypothetical protein